MKGFMRFGRDWLRDRRLRRRLMRVPSIDLSPVSQVWRDGGWSRKGAGLLPMHLPEGSILDFGGYTGDLSSLLAKRYRREVHVFEPVPQYVETLLRRFGSDGRIAIHPIGIGASAGMRTFHLNSDGSGEFGNGAESVNVRFESPNYLDSLGLGTVALAIVNIEGGEYELIPSLVESGWIDRFEILLIQFHKINADSYRLRTECQFAVSASHDQQFDYPFVWEGWRRRGSTDLAKVGTANTGEEDAP